jgi:hypothetical protein
MRKRILVFVANAIFLFGMFAIPLLVQESGARADVEAHKNHPKIAEEGGGDEDVEVRDELLQTASEGGGDEDVAIRDESIGV